MTLTRPMIPNHSEPRGETSRRVAILVLAMAFVCAACSKGAPAHGPSGPPVTVLPTSPTELPTVTLAQFEQMLAGLHGTPVLVNVWASWCGPCVKEAPLLATLAKEYEGTVRFVGLDVDDTTSNARAFIGRFGWTFPSVADPKAEVRNGLGYIGQPVTIIFDASGTKVFDQSGVEETTLRAALAKAT